MILLLYILFAIIALYYIFIVIAIVSGSSPFCDYSLQVIFLIWFSFLQLPFHPRRHKEHKNLFLIIKTVPKSSPNFRLFFSQTTNNYLKKIKTTFCAVTTSYYFVIVNNMIYNTLSLRPCQ